MDLIVVVVAIVVLISLIVVMFRYAGFIHQGPSAGKPAENQNKDETENTSDQDKG